MTPLDLNLVLFILAIAIFAWIGFSAGRKEHSVNDYFHHNNLNKNVVSLTATNISLGTGLVYLISGAQQNGLLMIMPVFCVGVGYWLLSMFLGRATNISLRTGKNFLASIDLHITQLTGRPSWFAKSVSGSLVFVFVLLLAFEIFASAKVISPFLFTASNTSSEVIVAISIFCITVLYTLLGGVRAMFGVDIIQIPLICLFLPVFIITGIPDWNEPTTIATRLITKWKATHGVIISVAIACINSIATQFYSILNWGALSNVELSHQRKLLKRVGLATSCVLFVFVLVGLLHPIGQSGQAWHDLSQYYSSLSTQSSLYAYVMSAILMLGMASILLTTTDAVVVNCILFFYDNLAGGNSKSNVRNPIQLRKIRFIGFSTFGVCFIVLLAINYLQPDPFYLLLSMAGGIIVFAPMIVTAGIFASRANALRVFNNKVILLFICLFIASGIADIILLSQKSQFVAYVGASAFILSNLICLVLYLKTRNDI